jgi:hypothetical protein
MDKDLVGKQEVANGMHDVLLAPVDLLGRLPVPLRDADGIYHM